AGQIAGAAKRVESSLAGLLSLAISFLAGFVGLGGVAEKVKAAIKKVQTAVDKALDTAVNWGIGKAKALFAELLGKDGAPPGKEKPAAGQAAEAPPGAVLITLGFSMSGEGHELKLQRVGNELKAEMSSATLVDVKAALGAAAAAANTDPELKKSL